MVSTSPANETDDAALQAELFSQCDQGASLLADISGPRYDSDEIEDPSSDSEVPSTDDHDLDDLACNALNHDDALQNAADPLLVSFLTK